MIRGFSANRILIVLDGIRLNNAIYRSGNLHNIISIDPNVLEGAEVLFGPASVIYGSDAIGGVMDFHTKNIKFSIIVGVRLELTVCFQLTIPVLASIENISFLI